MGILQGTDIIRQKMFFLFAIYLYKLMDYNFAYLLKFKLGQYWLFGYVCIRNLNSY